MNITLLEPQCRGLEHVPFNSALLRTVLLSEPDANVVFSGDADHVSSVCQELGDSFPDRKIRWQSEFGGISRGESLFGLPGLFREAFRIREYCREERVDVLVLCSSSPALLAAVIALRPLSTAVLVVLHACLAQLRNNPVTQCLRNPLSIHTVARIPVPPGMRVIVLGAPILKNVQAMGLGSRRWESIDHPSSVLTCESDVHLPPPVRFGYLAGFERNSPETKAMLERVVSATDCRMNWIGRESDSSEALSSGEYRKRLGESHYAIWLGDASEYRLRASATFLDAMAMGKPLIYLRNDFVDYYNSTRGPFGFPVSSASELEEKLIQLARDPLDDSYKHLAQSALAVSRTFSPEALAPGLHSIIANVCGEVRQSKPAGALEPSISDQSR